MEIITAAPRYLIDECSVAWSDISSVYIHFGNAVSEDSDCQFIGRLIKQDERRLLFHGLDSVEHVPELM